MSKIFSFLSKAGVTALLVTGLPLVSDAQVSVRDFNTYFKKSAEGKNVSLFHRYEISPGLTFGSGAVNIHDRFRDESNQNVITGTNRTTTFNYRSMSGYSAVYFPLSYFGPRSMMALNLGLYGVVNTWDIGNTSLDPNVITSYEASDMVIGVPIGIDLIWGGEASLNKGDKVTLRGGAGLMPYFAAGSLADGSEDYAKIGIKPYVKAELGFFAGVEWKVRGMVVAGSRTLYDYHTGDYNLQESDYYYSFNFKIRPTYTIGIAVFPFSFGWDSDKW